MWAVVSQNPREDLESRSPNLGPFATKGTLKEPPLRDLLFGFFPGVWVVGFSHARLGLEKLNRLA